MRRFSSPGFQVNSRVQGAGKEMALFSFGNTRAGKRRTFFFGEGNNSTATLDLPQGLHDTQGFRLALVSLDQAQTRVRDSQKVDVGVLLTALHHRDKTKLKLIDCKGQLKDKVT